MIEHVIIDKNSFSPQLLLPSQFGLVIGQYDSDTAVRVILHCVTPEKEKDASTTPADGKQKHPPTFGDSPGPVDSEWIGRHAENVFRSLPGGLDIVGVFYCSREALGADSEQVALLKTALSRVQDLTGTIKLTKETVCSQKVIMLVRSDTAASDISCLATDAANPIGGLSRVSRCEQSNRQSWLSLTSRFTLNCRAAVSAQSVANNNLTDQLHQALQPCAIRALDFAPLYDGAALTPEAPLPFPDRGAADAAFREPVFVELLQSCAAEPGSTGGDSALLAASAFAKEELAGGRRLEVSGCFPLYALVRPGAPGSAATRALKSDLARGLDARLHLAAQELSISSGLIVEGKSPVLRLPRRVLVRHPRCPQAVLSDYSFPGETSQDVLDRLGYFFSAELSPEDVDFGPEVESNSGASSPADDLSADEAELMEGVDRVVNTKVPLYYVLGLGVLFLAALVAVLAYKA